jgi:hypothetical protein
MIHIHPILYQYICSTSSSLVTLPLDIAQTKILSPKEVNIELSEIKWLLLFPLIFTSQNIVYNELSNIKNTIIRGALAGFLTSPIYTFLETKKMYQRLKILPKYDTYFKIILIRQTLFYSILYEISEFNMEFSNFIAAIIANTIGFPIKLIAFSYSYSFFIINKKTIKITALLEILKASISDGLALFLIYKPSFSPFNN